MKLVLLGTGSVRYWFCDTGTVVVLLCGTSSVGTGVVVLVLFGTGSVLYWCCVVLVL